ncbi:MAG: tyrB [Anaerosporomusa subterranea]|jgi:aromatic-amino-acid transaminase|nr:tyrB [Anaerosporomusa subterranea]
MNFVPSHARGKVAVDKIFGAGAKAQQAVNKVGQDKVVNGAQGVLLDEEEKLVCLPTVEKVLRNLSTADLISYAPIRGLPEFLNDVIDVTFEEYKPNAYFQSIATAGGAGALHHAIWNYSEAGDTILTTDWFWSPYRVLCKGALRKLDVFALFDNNLKFNLEDFENKTSNLLKKQNNLLVILNTPAHNPTGYSLSDDDWEAVLTDCKKNAQNKDKRITLLIDAAYLDYTGDLEGRKFFRKFENLPENILVIVAVSLSKSLTMYGQRTGAMIGISSDREVIEEFVNVNEYTSRATWSNINRGAMKTLSTIYRDKTLLNDVQKERNRYLEIIEERARLFITEAELVNLGTLPYLAGFFMTIPTAKPDEICDLLNEENIFLVPLDKGVRIAVCAIPSKKIPGLATTIKKAMIAI